MGNIDKINQIYRVDEKGNRITECIDIYFDDGKSPRRINTEKLDSKATVRQLQKVLGENDSDYQAMTPSQKKDYFTNLVNNGKMNNINVADKASKDAAEEEFIRRSSRGTTPPRRGRDEGKPPVLTKKKSKAPKVFAILGVSALGIGAVSGLGYGVYKLVKHIQHKQIVQQKEDDDTLEKNDVEQQTDVSFEKMIQSMDENDKRRIVAEGAMTAVTNFHNSTHKPLNFRLDSDGETYLDLTTEEAIVLKAFANYTEPADLYEIFGTSNLSSSQVQNLIESARSKLSVYYMNATEPSGLASIFDNPNDRAFFERFENDILHFNKTHTQDSSDRLIADVYYSFVLDGAVNETNVGSLARALAYDCVEGMVIKESGSKAHEGLLSFEGWDKAKETEYYVRNYLGLDYSSLSQEDKDTYSKNIIEKGTKLVSSDPDVETLHSIIRNSGICSGVKDDVLTSMDSLNMQKAMKDATVEQQIVAINNSIVSALTEKGKTELVSEVIASINERLPEDLIEEISDAGCKTEVANYDAIMESILGADRPELDAISQVASDELSQIDNYSPSERNIATLVNNRRHIEYVNEKDETKADEKGYLGTEKHTVKVNGKETEKELPVYDMKKAGVDTNDKKEVDKFVKEHGEVIDTKKTEKKEEIPEEKIPEKDQAQVIQQQHVIMAQHLEENSRAQGGIAANDYANSEGRYNYDEPSVVDPANGEVYILSEQSFANSVAYATAFGTSTFNSNDYRIQNAARQDADNYVDVILSNEAIEEYARISGISVDEARNTIKGYFIEGFTEQIENEIQSAVEVGMDMKRISQEAINATNQLNNNLNNNFDFNGLPNGFNQNYDQNSFMFGNGSQGGDYFQGNGSQNTEQWGTDNSLYDPFLSGGDSHEQDYIPNMSPTSTMSNGFESTGYSDPSLGTSFDFDIDSYIDSSFNNDDGFSKTM